MLHIRLLGSFRLYINDALVDAIDSPRQQELLAYLLLHRDAPNARTEVAQVLWPDSTAAQQRTNLRQLLFTLRRRLPAIQDFLTGDEQTIGWRGDLAFTLDVADFEQALQHANASAGHVRVAALEAAVAQYTGDLLPDRYEDWILAARERLGQRYVAALEELIDLQSERGEYKPAIAHAQRLLRYDPVRETTYRRLMHLHALAGDAAAALRVYHTCVTALAQELDVAPAEATHNLYLRLLDSGGAPALSTPRPVPADSTALVGRQTEWAALQACWQQSVRGRAHLSVIAGEAGIGKTRLAEELVRWVVHRGVTAVRTRAYAAVGSLAYAPVIEWLRSVLYRPVLGEMAQDHRAELMRLLPELSSQWPELPQPTPMSGAAQRLLLLDALTAAILLPKDPLLLVLDDLQWCDAESLEWLGHLLQVAEDRSLLVVGTLRPEEVAQGHPYTALRYLLQSRGQLTTIELDALTPEETAALAEQVAGKHLDSTQRERLYKSTEGSPLFIVETVREQDSAARAGDDSIAMPRKIQAVIQTRLARLSPPARDLAGIAAIIGRNFAVDLLAASATQLPATLLPALDELWQRRIIREQGTDAYDFSHDRIRDVAYGELSPPRRRFLHRRVAEALEKVNAAAPGDMSGQLAAHYEQAGAPDLAIAWYWQAVEAARRRFAQRDVIALARRGLALLAPLPDSVEWQKLRLSFSIALAGAITATAGILDPEVLDLFTTMQQLAARLGDKVQQYEAQRGLWGCYLNRLWVPRARRQAADNLALAQSIDNPRCLRDAYCNMGLAALEIGSLEKAVGFLEQAMAVVVPPETPPLTVFGFELGLEAPLFCASAEFLLGRADRARWRIESALAYTRTLPDLFTQQMMLVFACQAYQIARDVAALEQAARQSVALARRYDLFSVDVELYLEWALVQQTRAVDACLRLRACLERYQQGENYQLTYYLGLTAEAYATVGLHDEALALLDTALARVASSGETFWRAELHRLRGASLLALGAGDAEADLQQALAIARAQGARLLAMRSAIDLANHWQAQGRSADARRLIAEAESEFGGDATLPDLSLPKSGPGALQPRLPHG